MGHAHGHDQARLPPLSRGVLHPRLGGRPHMVRDQAAVGRRPQGEHQQTLVNVSRVYLISGVCQRFVECS